MLRGGRATHWAMGKCCPPFGESDSRDLIPTSETLPGMSRTAYVMAEEVTLARTAAADKRGNTEERKGRGLEG
jgi:hypothetical protein